jgi:drug/metabolite transporter (DMT)-like permease
LGLIDRRIALLLTLPPLFWAGNAVVARALVGEFPPVALSILRWMLAFALLLPFAWRGLVAARPVLRAEWKRVAILGVIGVGGYNTLQYLAVQTSTAVSVTLIGSSTPIFMLAAGTLFFGERARRLFSSRL